LEVVAKFTQLFKPILASNNFLTGTGLSLILYNTLQIIKFRIVGGSRKEEKLFGGKVGL
jgi:hypothetical protein